MKSSFQTFFSQKRGRTLLDGNQTKNMAQKLGILLLILSIGPLMAKQATHYTNKCWNNAVTKYDRSTPGPEPTLECKQYRGKACCKPGIAESFVSDEIWQSFLNFNHCPQKKARLSPECHKMFLDQLCFSVCSPNLGPWITKLHKDKNGLDRLMHVPICQSTCDTWWAACKKEYTCTDDWFNLLVVNGESPVCSATMPCKTYEEYFKNDSTYFCENIWDNTYKVHPDDQPCMKFVYDESKTNPNEAVELQKAAELIKSGK